MAEIVKDESGRRVVRIYSSYEQPITEIFGTYTDHQAKIVRIAEDQQSEVIHFTSKAMDEIVQSWLAFRTNQYNITSEYKQARLTHMEAQAHMVLQATPWLELENHGDNFTLWDERKKRYICDEIPVDDVLEYVQTYLDQLKEREAIQIAQMAIIEKAKKLAALVPGLKIEEVKYDVQGAEDSEWVVNYPPILRFPRIATNPDQLHNIVLYTIDFWEKQQNTTHVGDEA